MALTTATSSDASSSDLWYFLKDYKLEDLYSTLKENSIELEHLKSIDASDVDELCQSLELNIHQKIRFKSCIKDLNAQKQNKYIQKNIKTVHLNTTQNIAIIGNSCVGKTWLIHRLKNQREPGSGIGYTTTTENTSIEMKISDSLSANYQFWDTPGQTAYRDTAPLYFKGALAIIVVFDICDEDSFESVKSLWFPMIESNGKGYDKILILGNKLDLKANRKVQQNMVRQFAFKKDCEYIEISAKTGDNISELLFPWIHSQTEKRVAKGGQQELMEEQRALLFSDQKVEKKRCCSK